MAGGKVISSIIGAIGLGVVAYDAHNVGKIQSDLYASERDAKATAYYLNNDMYVTNMSRSQEKVRDWAFKVQLGEGVRRFINVPIGYVKGFFTMLISHVVPLALSLGALFGKGKTAKGSAIGLAIYAGYKAIRNIFGLGTPGSLTK